MSCNPLKVRGEESSSVISINLLQFKHMLDFCFSMCIWDVKMLSIFGIAVTPCCHKFQTRGHPGKMCAFFPSCRGKSTVSIGTVCVRTILCVLLAYTGLVEEQKRWRLQAAWENWVTEFGILWMLQRVSNMTCEQVQSLNKQQLHLFPNLCLFFFNIAINVVPWIYYRGIIVPANFDISTSLMCIKSPCVQLDR